MGHRLLLFLAKSRGREPYSGRRWNSRRHLDFPRCRKARFGLTRQQARKGAAKGRLVRKARGNQLQQRLTSLVRGLGLKQFPTQRDQHFPPVRSPRDARRRGAVRALYIMITIDLPSVPITVPTSDAVFQSSVRELAPDFNGSATFVSSSEYDLLSSSRNYRSKIRRRSLELPKKLLFNVVHKCSDCKTELDATNTREKTKRRSANE